MLKKIWNIFMVLYNLVENVILIWIFLGYGKKIYVLGLVFLVNNIKNFYW